MTNTFHCPECEQSLTRGEVECSCGWSKKPHQQPTPPPVDDRCAYIALGRRCSLHGTMSHHRYATSAWYCHLHWQAYGDVKQGEEALREAEANCHTIMAERIDWRRQLHTNVITTYRFPLSAKSTGQN